MNISTYMLMKACARGTRQSQFIDELIENDMRIRPTTFWAAYAYDGGGYITQYGKTKLTSSSWLGLRKRLRAHGFTVYIKDGEYVVGPGVHSTK